MRDGGMDGWMDEWYVGRCFGDSQCSVSSKRTKVKKQDTNDVDKIHKLKRIGVSFCRYEKKQEYNNVGVIVPSR
jgi:hypothetical protein